MKELIIVGGIPYSGKSTFCRNLESRGVGRYTHIDFDGLFNELCTDGFKFFKYLRILEPRIADDIQIGGIQQGIHEPTQQLRNFGRFMTKKEGPEKFEYLVQQIAGIYLTEKLLNSSNTPILEGLFTDKIRRVGSYDAIKSYIPKLIPPTHENSQALDLDSVKKTLIYFNLGLETSLKRWKKGREQKYEAVITSEKLIRTVYGEQKLPSSKELPNLEIILINHPSEAEAIIKRLAEI